MIKDIETTEHVWSFELWAPHQLGPATYPIQLPDHTPAFTAETPKAAREHAASLAQAGWSVGAGSHHRGRCCKIWVASA